VANTVANGQYIMVTKENTSLALDVQNGERKNGTNIQVYTVNYTRAQWWKVTKTSTGYEILSRWLGKCVDVTNGAQVSGTNIELWEDNDSRAQRFDFVDSGDTLTFNGKSYPCFIIYPHGNKKVVLDVYGQTYEAVAGQNVWLYSYESGNNGQKWAFIPVPTFRSGGVYELRTLMAPTKLTLDVDGMYKANGSNVMLGSINHGNNQKFYLTNEGDGWSIRDINSGKYIDVAGGKTTTNEANVQIYQDNDTRAQRWKATEFGEKTVNGKTCAVVQLGAGNADTCVMDAYLALAKDRQNVMIGNRNDGDNQKWVLWPTSAVDANMPTPYNVKLAEKWKGTGYFHCQPKDVLYPTWQCSDAWVTDGANSYRWRWRKRFMKGSTSAWMSWSAWTAWETASAYTSGKNVWETHGINVNYQFSDNIKNCEVEMQVCSQGIASNDTDNITSSIKDQVCQVIRKPTMKLTGAAWSYDGLRVSYETDYPYGSITIHLQGLTFNGKNALKKSVDVTARGGTFLVPQSSIKSKPKDGATAALTFTLGNDQWETFGGGISSGSAAIAYDAGTVDVTPTVVESDGLTLTCTVPYTDTVRMWMVTDGKSTELTGAVKSGKTVFSYIYPFGKTMGIFTSYANSDGSEWGTDYTEVAAKTNPHIHIWNWDGGYLALWLDESQVSEKRTYSTESEQHILAGRSHPAVSFLCDSNGSAFTSVSSTVSGVLVPDDKYGCTVDDVEALIEESHVTYRSPYGRMASVAITGADIERFSRYSTVSISQVEEQL
jgi:hypothetical protein